MLLAAAAAACSLLTSAEIQRVQGEAPKEARPSAQQGPALRGEQCFYLLPDFAKSISLEVTRGDVRAFWQKTFHGEPAARERDPDDGRDAQAGKPQRVRGLGDEAFWAGDARLGGLYVLRKDAMLRLSVGGRETVPQKLKKLRALARRALKRL